MPHRSEEPETIDFLDGEKLSEIRARGTGGTVAADIDAWLREAGVCPDDGCQHGRLALTIERPPYDSGHASACVALLHLNPAAFNDVDWPLERIEQQFGTDVGLLAYLEGRAAHATTEVALAAAAAGGDALGELLRCRCCEIDGADVVIAPGGRLPLAAALAAFIGHPLSLWRFRRDLQGGMDAFEGALLRRGAEFRGDVRKGLLTLFENGADPTPSEFLDAFPGVPESDGTLEAVLAEMSFRMRTTDGFRSGPPAVEWLKAVAGMRNWSPDRLRTLLALPDTLPPGSETELSAAVGSAVTHLSKYHPTAAVHGALSLLRLARLAREDGRLMKHAELEAGCLRFVARLPEGDGITAVWRLYETVPLRPGRRGAAWAWLSDQVKRHWASKLVKEAAGSPVVTAGLVEFLLTWAPKEVAVDFEWAVVELVERFGLEDMLGRLAERGEDVCGLRAGALFTYLSLGKPP